MNNMRGVGVALVTPFNKNRDIDFDALARLVRHVTDGGVDYLVALGTTGETPTLSKTEKAEALACIRENNTKSLPLVVGIGCNSTQHVVDDIAATDLRGVEAVLSVTPYYNKPSQRGLYEHYKAIAAASPVPIMLYNVPGRTGVNMTAETTLKLAHEVENICGVKEACGSISQMAEILRGRPEGFLVISGDDEMILPLISIGGDGIISVLSNLLPAEFTAMVAAGFKGDIATAAALQMRLHEATQALFEEGNPVGVKAGMAVKGLSESYVRLPLVEGSDCLTEKFRRIFAENNL